MYPGAGAWVHIYVPRRWRLGTHFGSFALSVTRLYALPEQNKFVMRWIGDDELCSMIIGWLGWDQDSEWVRYSGHTITKLVTPLPPWEAPRRLQ